MGASPRVTAGWVVGPFNALQPNRGPCDVNPYHWNLQLRHASWQVAKRRLASARIAYVKLRIPANGVDRVKATSDSSGEGPCVPINSIQMLSPRHFINLTNGIEALPYMESLISKEEVRFTRIQSSHCESGAYDKLLSSLDTELLFSLACGRDCYIYDFASRNKTCGVSRALFLGVEFIKWSLAYLWFSSESPLVPDCALVRGKNTVPFWRNEVLQYKIGKDTKKRLRYFSTFAKEFEVKEIKLHGVYGRVSEIDGCKELHVKMVKDWLDGAEAQVGDHGQHFNLWSAKFKLAQYDNRATANDLVRIQNWMSNR